MLPQFSTSLLSHIGEALEVSFLVTLGLLVSCGRQVSERWPLPATLLLSLHLSQFETTQQTFEHHVHAKTGSGHWVDHAKYTTGADILVESLTINKKLKQFQQLNCAVNDQRSEMKSRVVF